MKKELELAQSGIKECQDGFEIIQSDKVLIKHTIDCPFAYIGQGKEDIKMYRGNFSFKDYISSRLPLSKFEINDNTIDLYFDNEKILSINVVIKNSDVELEFTRHVEKFNRIWIRINADKEEKIYGCGEQMTYFNLRGKNFPLWTSEPGVGRNKNTYVTWCSDRDGMAGGDYYNTNFPQPTFISSNKYFMHVHSTAYMDFNFKNDNFHELEIWEIPSKITIKSANTYLELVKKVSDLFGRSYEMPEWINDGVILGVQGGTELVLNKVNSAIEKGLKVNGIWAQDWQGKRITSFGKRLNWNWEWNEKEYPNLDKEIVKLNERGIRFLGYINPYVVNEGSLYKEALEKDYLAKTLNNEVYLVDFGEFDCGIVDFTNPEAFEWFKDVIKTNMIDFNLSGWMADFSEYLPYDVKLFNNQDGMLAHNDWPRLWAKANYEAITEKGKQDEIMFFMRAGFSGMQKYCPVLWAGDQSVDFTYDDGLATTIPAALSSGMSGMGISHSDIGGYTSLYENKRSKELFMRWADASAFTPVMRTHEGNRPSDNHQFDDDEETLMHLVKMVDIFVALKPYMRDVIREYTNTGVPAQRPLFMHYEEDINSYDIRYEYLLGKDLLVAPVLDEGVSEWDVYLPEDEWIHLWSKEEYNGGNIRVKAPIGQPPVFYRKDSDYKSLFDLIK